ncbi:MAG: GntR family transcriptional regulator [Lachnospiraceae bacterium]|nr:GntR family transcriptional regulator [Lachnospiraceae bacterium]MDD3794463.1 GntR family transcriptional regulator [Lachnospiraceae bacterium]
MAEATWTPSPQVTKNAPDYVIEQIRNALLTRELNPGDRLPSEMELASLFNVSRGSVRQAMKSLEMLGILTIRPGDGTCINTTVSHKSFNSLTFALLISRPPIKMIADARYAFERDILELIMEDEERIEAVIPLLNENLQFHKTLLEQHADAKALAENDKKFHLILSASCGNLVLQTVYDYVMETVEYYMTETTAQQITGDFNHTLHDHAAIISALQDRNYGDAKRAAKITADTWNQLLLDGKQV